MSRRHSLHHYNSTSALTSIQLIPHSAHEKQTDAPIQRLQMQPSNPFRHICRSRMLLLTSSGFLSPRAEPNIRLIFQLRWLHNRLAQRMQTIFVSIIKLTARSATKCYSKRPPQTAPNLPCKSRKVSQAGSAPSRDFSFINPHLFCIHAVFGGF